MIVCQHPTQLCRTFLGVFRMRTEESGNLFEGTDLEFLCGGLRLVAFERLG